MIFSPSVLKIDMTDHCLMKVCQNKYRRGMTKWGYDIIGLGDFAPIVQLLMSSRGFSLLIRVVIYQNVHLDE